ncbi:TIR domain-containing protein [Marinomonas shanghaiensis]|uniref:TIR domain-containing protein n=1 Tax=Marinomonas shanghaiensis TaxID=2202418 RepID=UPI000DB9DE67|nr:toll/interleukin-1 receptor domain-containing protein [Marinomonas shanghaiensis]
MEHNPISFFYSYCHKDNDDRRELEVHLSMLVRNRIIEQWHDGKILAGQPWKSEILKSLEKAEIVVFLVTPNWLSSDACIEEWHKAIEFSKTQPNKQLIPIIAKTCGWLDFDNMSVYQAIPYEGKPVSTWLSREEAWHDVYERIKAVANELKKNFQLNEATKSRLCNIEFCSAKENDISLKEIFVFPNLYAYPVNKNGLEIDIDDAAGFHSESRQFVVGDSQSGKTKFCSWLYINDIDQSQPSLMVDFDEVGTGKDKRKILQEIFFSQQTGDFNCWFESTNKRIYFDNLSKDSKCAELIKYAEEHFVNISVFSSSDIYESYYSDDERFAEFREINLKPFCHSKQEELIKKWVSLKDGTDEVDYTLIDKLEDKVNAIVINNKVLPRYPFFILSILQTFESFMPEDLKISAYGHCYHALILARLIKSGINNEDSAIGSAFTFCSNFAYEIFKKGDNSQLSEFQFAEFYRDYSNEYLMKESVKNRLFDSSGLLFQSNSSVKFTIAYTYYYFLGKYLAENYQANKDAIHEMVNSSFAKHNSLILIFTIHHANDMDLIDEILTHTACVIDNVEPVTLSKEETVIFSAIVNKVIPEKIARTGEVSEERTIDRKNRTKHEEAHHQDDREVESIAAADKMMHQVFQCNKNIEILSQILKNKTGSLKKAKLQEIIEIICDASLRMASVIVANSSEIDALASYVFEQYKKSDEYDASESEFVLKEKIKSLLTVRAMLWVLMSIEKSVKAINKPELKGIIISLCDQKSTAAYHLIKYFYLLDSAEKFDFHMKSELEFMVKNYSKDKHLFMNRIVSIRTQHYEKTHKIQENYRQSIFSILNIDYKKAFPRRKVE